MLLDVMKGLVQGEMAASARSRAVQILGLAASASVWLLLLAHLARAGDVYGTLTFLYQSLPLGDSPEWLSWLHQIPAIFPTAAVIVAGAMAVPVSKDWYTGALLSGPRDMWPWVITLAAAVNLGAERAAQIFACSAFAYLALAFVTSVAWMNRPDRAGRRIFAMPSEVGLAAGLLLATAVVVFLLPMLLFGSVVEALYRGFSHEPISGNIQGSRQDLTGYGTKFHTAAHLAGSIRGDLHVQAPNAAGRSSDV